MTKKIVTEQIKRLAFSTGAKIIGAISTAVYENSIIDKKNKKESVKTKFTIFNPKSIIIIGYQVEHPEDETAIRKNNKVVHPFYDYIFHQSDKIIYFLQKNGYQATNKLNYLSHKKIAQLAGLGNYGKNSMIINKIYGPWLRFTLILTDARLIYSRPLKQKNICGLCQECIKSCPVGAINNYKVYPSKCLLAMSDKRKKKSDIKIKFEKYCPHINSNSIIMCSECLKACPIKYKI